MGLATIKRIADEISAEQKRHCKKMSELRSKQKKAERGISFKRKGSCGGS